MLCMYVCILFIYIHQLHFADDWRCDGYRWYQNGIKNIPRKNPVIKKTYFILKTPTGTSNNFKRHAYQLLNAAKPFVLIQYLGNNECAIQYPHKNVKSGSHPHIRTCPSVLEKIADVCTNRSRCRCCKQGQKCSKSCHKGKRCTNTEGQVSTDDAIDISDLTPSPKKFKHTNTWLDIENYTLTIDDRDSITNGEWLNDNHINAAQSLLKTKFPNVQYLQHANYATTLTDCGVLAIAFATAICHGIDPTNSII